MSAPGAQWVGISGVFFELAPERAKLVTIYPPWLVVVTYRGRGSP